MNERELFEFVTDVDSGRFEPEARLKGGTLGGVLEEILFHAECRYWQFTPTHANAPRFLDRLLAWLTNPSLSREDKESLLRSIPHLQFVDRDDMLTLYRSAFSGPIMRWIMDQLNLDFSQLPGALEDALREGVRTTWFCPLTDSMDIAQFNHVNGISGQEFRPTWRTLKKFGNIEKITSYMQENGLKRIILLEDFVGSGRQMKNVLNFMATHFLPNIPILVVPLIISDYGLNNIRDAVGSPAGLTILPVFVIPSHAHLPEIPSENETELMSELRNLVLSTYDIVRQPMPPETEPLDEPFGFGKVGTLVILYTNCPNNTLPLIWHRAPLWKPLFARVSRA